MAFIGYEILITCRSKALSAFLREYLRCFERHIRWCNVLVQDEKPGTSVPKWFKHNGSYLWHFSCSGSARGAATYTGCEYKCENNTHCIEHICWTDSSNPVVGVHQLAEFPSAK